MDFRPTESQSILRRAVREFAEQTLAPHVLEWDEAQRFPVEILPELSTLGLLGIQVPSDYGGRGCRRSSIAFVSRSSRGSTRRLRSRWRPTTAWRRRTSSCSGRRASGPVPCHGSPQVRRVGGWALTEPAAGSDAGATRTTATRRGDEWVLDGTKTFTTHGSVAGIIVVMAVTASEKGHRGISAFIVERGTPGLVVGRKENKLGMRASDTAELRFEECVVSRRADPGCRG